MYIVKLLLYCTGFAFVCNVVFNCVLQKTDSLGKLYEMDDSPERRAWLDKLLAFMEERRTPITTCPTISKNPLDLFRLYMYVKERGGFMEVCKVQCSSIVDKLATYYPIPDSFHHDIFTAGLAAGDQHSRFSVYR